MKTKILTIAGVAFFTGILSSSVKAEKISENSSIAYFQTSTMNSQNDEYKKYRDEQEKKIRENEKKISDLRMKKTDMVKEDRAKYDEKIDKIEKKNNELKARLKSNTKEEGKDKWESFKREYNHDMDELGKSLKDIGKDNVK